MEEETRWTICPTVRAQWRFKSSAAKAFANCSFVTTNTTRERTIAWQLYCRILKGMVSPANSRLVLAMDALFSLVACRQGEQSSGGARRPFAIRFPTCLLTLLGTATARKVKLTMMAPGPDLNQFPGTSWSANDQPPSRVNDCCFCFRGLGRGAFPYSFRCLMGELIGCRFSSCPKIMDFSGDVLPQVEAVAASLLQTLRGTYAGLILSPVVVLLYELLRRAPAV